VSLAGDSKQAAGAAAAVMLDSVTTQSRPPEQQHDGVEQPHRHDNEDVERASTGTVISKVTERNAAPVLRELTSDVVASLAGRAERNTGFCCAETMQLPPPMVLHIVAPPATSRLVPFFTPRLRPSVEALSYL
jgi:hypothetical protein